VLCLFVPFFFSLLSLDEYYLFPGYIGEFELVDDHRGGKIVVELNGRLNKCGVISPRYNVGVGETENWTARLLPSRQVCYSGSLSVRGPPVRRGSLGVCYWSIILPLLVSRQVWQSVCCPPARDASQCAALPYGRVVGVLPFCQVCWPVCCPPPKGGGQ